jgi:enoyl-CoA hydratase/carnithine racemase
MSDTGDTAAVAAPVVVDVPAAGVRRIRIGNERHRGALSQEVLSALIDAVRGTPADARCLILTGTGSTFSAGYDLAALSSPPDPAHADATIAPDEVEVLTVLEHQPLPVVAALNGPAIGGGLELALACDLRIAVPSASLGAPAGRLGLVYSPGGLERICAEIPLAVACDLFLAGGTLSAERGHELGLINRLVDPSELADTAVAVAQAIAELSPSSVQANREALRALRRAGGVLSAADRERLRHARELALCSRDFAEGVAAFRERRHPRFS